MGLSDIFRSADNNRQANRAEQDATRLARRVAADPDRARRDGTRAELDRLRGEAERLRKRR